jgi:hypothetical protein
VYDFVQSNWPKFESRKSTDSDLKTEEPDTENPPAPDSDGEDMSVLSEEDFTEIFFGLRV